MRVRAQPRAGGQWWPGAGGQGSLLLAQGGPGEAPQAAGAQPSPAALSGGCLRAL